LPPRSLLVLRGEARWGWSHSITPRMTELPPPPDGGGGGGGGGPAGAAGAGAPTAGGGVEEPRRIRRGKRYSLTFRRVRPRGQSCRCVYPACCDSQLSRASADAADGGEQPAVVAGASGAAGGAVGGGGRGGGGGGASVGTVSTRQVCRNWNAHRCSFGDACRRVHVCSKCGSAQHAALDCDDDCLGSCR
jgi:hypothetical protein